MSAVVAVEGLTVLGRDEAGRAARIVDDVSFSIGRGEVAALIGQSGSGKSTIALTLLGYVRPGCRIIGGRVVVGGRDLASLSRLERERLRGNTVAYVAQSAAAAFNPSRRLLPQIVEGSRIHGTRGRAEAEAKAIGLFKSLALPEPETIGQRFPHQVSGGQLQRLMLAMAMMSDPAVIVLDEPTTALDVTTQIEVLKAFKAAFQTHAMTVLYVSHDLAVVAQMADRVVVLEHGKVRESGAVGALIAAPQHAYTQALLAAVDRERLSGAHTAAAPASIERPAAPSEPPSAMLKVHGIVAGYGPTGRAGLPAVPALRDVSLTVEAGSSVGIIGESGSGKSTLARVIAGLLPQAKGTMHYDGAPLPARVADRTKDQLRDIQIVFQSADTALNPTHPVGRILARPVRLFHGLSGSALDARVRELLDMVRLPADFARRMPAELSGGQRQRVSLARALAAKPRLVLCDEVTSGLDTIVGAAILDLLAELRRSLGLSYLFISHDLSTVRAVCDEVMILYAGERVETASHQAFRTPPLHPYADLLLGSIPELRVGWLAGFDTVSIARPASAASAMTQAGCPFQPRCVLARPGLCDRVRPPERRLASGASILCHLTEGELLSARDLAH